MNKYLLCGALLGFLSICMGAYADHGLKFMIDDKSIEMTMTAIRYQQIHALLVAVIGLFLYLPLSTALKKRLKLSALMFIIGILIFSFSIYTAVIFGVHNAINITPLGGVTLMLGWILLGWTSLISDKKN